jgi:histidyl-tRNA synthetase
LLGFDVVCRAQVSSLEEMREIVGDASEGLRDLQELTRLSKAYGYEDWLVFSPSVVRGLSYYTGIVFECFDRQASIIKHISVLFVKSVSNHLISIIIDIPQ